jgi:hypothetical protein
LQKVSIGSLTTVMFCGESKEPSEDASSSCLVRKSRLKKNLPTGGTRYSIIKGIHTHCLSHPEIPTRLGIEFPLRRAGESNGSLSGRAWNTLSELATPRPSQSISRPRKATPAIEPRREKGRRPAIHKPLAS